MVCCFDYRRANGTPIKLSDPLTKVSMAGDAMKISSSAQACGQRLGTFGKGLD